MRTKSEVILIINSLDLLVLIFLLKNDETISSLG